MRRMKKEDSPFFIELVSKPEIIDPIPQQKWSEKEIQERFEEFSSYLMPPLQSEKTIWGIYQHGNDELIGLCGLLTNDEDDREVGYRFRKPYWGKGYGTEVTRGMLNYCFNQLDIALITADVNITNTASVRILERFMKPASEFFNEKDNCTDRRYTVSKEEWNTRAER